ncbi:unnamed protein product [Penicillium salamii]|nr:unnamed protein product [Penicillium salamii]CAG8096774.1 unnamed protein product [Penicillium salamii]CAG8377025.1 unnamed protein product [Penicillium salamii]CAG8388997.1 unnamed protein product [Penicillium salamii]CAG8889372.1 unnamed protein product [Penicillium salamii]
MESSGMVIPSAQEPSSTSTMSNTYPVSPVTYGAHDDGDAESQREGSPSEPIESHPVSESSPEPDAADDSYDGASAESDAEDEDAAADNSEYDANPYSRENSSSPHPGRGVKRMSSPQSETDLIRQNPDLYGLRRSGRARTTRNIADSSDSDSDVVAPRAKRRRKETSQQPSKASRSATVSSLSESDSDEYGGKSARASKARRRRLQQTASYEPSLNEVRFSTRTANKVSNYNEDDEEDEAMFEADPEDLAPSYWAESYAEDTRPAVDVVLNHRLKEGVDPKSQDLDRSDFEFCIKWQDKSHYHATWEPNEAMPNYRSTRRVDNYVRKVLNEDIRLQYDEDAPPEDREKWNLDRERDVEAIEDYKMVERVIGVRDGEDGSTEYLVKWKRLFYDSCTWEPEELVSEIAQREVDRFLDRTARQPWSDKNETTIATRKPFEPIHGGTPSFLQNGELKDFQIKGLNFLAFNWVRGRNVVLADEMGLGKTVQTVSFINWMRHVRRQQGPFIVIVPLSTMPAWADTFDHWTPDLNYVVYNGSEKARSVLLCNE